MKKRGGLSLAACCGCLCLASLGVAQTEDFQTLSKQAAQAYRAKDYATFLTLEKQALALAPVDPRTAYNVACGQALTGHPAEAVQQLNVLLARGLDMGADKDPDFRGIVQSAEWKQFNNNLADLRKPLVRSSPAFTLADKNLVATSVAVDPATGDTYIGSARERKVIKRTRDGALSDFVTAKDGLSGVTYVLVDAARKQLIVSYSALTFMQDYRKEDEGKSGIAMFDLSTGKLVRQANLPGVPEHHILAQTVVDSSGNLFIVDSRTAEIYRLRRASSEIELYISSVVFPTLQGIALSADERTLYVADFLQGLWAMEVLSTDRTHIDSAPDLYIAGLAGITRVDGGFVGVQVGVRPNRVVLIRMDAKGEKVTSLEILDRNLPEFDGPTQGSVAGTDFLYVANSQVGLVDPKTGTFAEDRAKATTILRLPLGK